MLDKQDSGQKNPFEGWVTIEEAAKKVDRPTETVRRWANDGKIEAFNIGESWIRVVNVEEVRRFSEKAPRLRRRREADKK
jgi:excisionase family DNA binding protein